MPNSNPQAVAFSNNYGRRGADNIISCYLTMKRLVQVWTGQGVAVVIPNDAGVIVDGSAVDGRQSVTNAQINILIANANAIIATFEANSNLILNQMLQVSVNAQSVLS